MKKRALVFCHLARQFTQCGVTIESVCLANRDKGKRSADAQEMCSVSNSRDFTPATRRKTKGMFHLAMGSRKIWRWAAKEVYLMHKVKIGVRECSDS